METVIVKRPYALSEMDFAGRTIKLETGKLAKLAQGAVVVTLGETMVLVTVGATEKAREGTDFLPLTVEYQEKFYATGKIKGSRFIKREGRPSDNAVLNGRVIDRPLRPLFPKGMRNDVQILVTILSADMETDPVNIAITAASAAVMLTGLPFEGPTAGVRIGMITNEAGKDELVVNPTYAQLESGKLDLMVAGTLDSITMVEAGSEEVAPEVFLEALELAHKHIKALCELQLEFVKKVNPTPMVADIKECPADLKEAVFAAVTDAQIDAMYGVDKFGFHQMMHTLEDALKEQFAEKLADETSGWTKGYLADAVEARLKKRMRQRILEEGKRLDNRGPRDIREVTCETGLIPRTHGSGLFNRGDTQVLSLTTLGSPGEAQIIDEMDMDIEKRYMHHYNFPPFATGEVRPMRGTSRREIGHGDLAERALRPVLPTKEAFPYVIRVVSETIACNGSSSMGSICGSTLSLMDAGVPLTRPVVGIAMGLVMDDATGKYVVLSDIIAQEDFLGDMDFKFAATDKGITALQMDIKITGLPVDLFRNALMQAEEGRQYIKGEMLKAIPTHRTEMSKYAPRIITLKVDPEMIRIIIGPGGKMINEIIDTTGAKIDIEDSGLVMITSVDAEGGAQAKAWIERLTYVPKAGDIFEGRVTKVMEFGAFVEIVPGKEGLVHISKLAPFRVNKVEEVVKMGDTLKVVLEEIDSQGRLNLSHKPFYKAKDAE